MPVAMRVKVVGVQALVRRLNKISPRKNPRWISKALVNSALLAQKISAEEEIKRGGRVAVRGPRGGRRVTDAAPIAGKLTSRSGLLRASIGTNRNERLAAQDRSRIPRLIEFGTDVKYGAVHEIGGPVRVPSSRVSAHTRTMAFGRRTQPFEVKAHTRWAHVAFYEPRPFLEPALDKAVLRMDEIFVKEWEREVVAS